MVCQDLVVAIHVFARNHYEVGILRKDCGESLVSARLIASVKSAMTLRMACSCDRS